MTKDARLLNAGKTVSSRYGGRNTAQLHVKKKKKDKTRSFFNSIHKHKLKMD